MHQNLYLRSTYHVPCSSAPQQHNAPQCPQGSDGWIGFAHHRQAVRVRQWTPQAFLWHCAQSTVKPTRATGGLTPGTVRLELFGNLTAYTSIPCQWLLYTYDVDYMTVADTMLAPINEQLITSVCIAFIFVYSLLQTLSCVLLCYSEPEHSCLWPSKYM